MTDTEKFDPRSRFIQLFTSHEKQIYRYILSLMPHSQDAQDVLQETAIALYNKIEDYDPTRLALGLSVRLSHDVETPGEVRPMASFPG